MAFRGNRLAISTALAELQRVQRIASHSHTYPNRMPHPDPEPLHHARWSGARMYGSQSCCSSMCERPTKEHNSERTLVSITSHQSGSEILDSPTNAFGARCH
jgi:hypothetical protein